MSSGWGVADRRAGARRGRGVSVRWVVQGREVLAGHGGTGRRGARRRAQGWGDRASGRGVRDGQTPESETHQGSKPTRYSLHSMIQTKAGCKRRRARTALRHWAAMKVAAGAWAGDPG